MVFAAESFDERVFLATINILGTCALQNDQSCLAQLDFFYHQIINLYAESAAADKLKNTLCDQYIALLASSAEPSILIDAKERLRLLGKIVSLNMDANCKFSANSLDDICSVLKKYFDSALFKGELFQPYEPVKVLAEFLRYFAEALEPMNLVNNNNNITQLKLA